MAEEIVTVFGGTGFLGRRVVGHLRDQGFAVRIASRHVEQAGDGIAQEWIRADINDEGSVTAAVGRGVPDLGRARRSARVRRARIFDHYS